MATATLEFDCPEGGTFTAELYARGADTLINTGGSACTERTNDRGCYTASIVDIASGTYKLRIRNAANVTIARGLLEHTNSAVVESPSAVDWDNIVAPTATVQLTGTTVKIQSGHTKNAALSNFTFLMVDSSDHITGKTGLTITATRSLDGAAFAACANSASEVGNGIYKINLAAADMNGDTVTLRFTGTGADARIIELITTP